jgi:hypothetical protein
MRKLQLGEWAAIGELIGTAAVVISLIFVGYSLRQNTDAVQGSTENLIFESHAALVDHFISDPSMADILARMRTDDPQLTEAETIRWETYQTNLLDIWALAYLRHERDLLADRHWKAWDDYFRYKFSYEAERLSFERWQELEYGYEKRFWAHVRSSVDFGS